MVVKDLIGQRFGKLLVVERQGCNKGGSALWRCACECGEERVVAGTGLRAGRHKSCGCASPRFDAERLKTHGFSKTRTYRIWQGMRKRCSELASGKERRLYWGKGIRVCERWQSFEHFLADMGEAPEGLSIDRIDGNGHYEPSNCRWASSKEQANNTSKNSLITHNGKTQTLALWAEEAGVKANTLLYRLKRGVDLARAMQPEIGFISKIKAQKRETQCVECGASFIPRTSQLKQGRGKFCSRACSGAASKRSR